MKKKIPQVVTIAGSDSGGGAGVQADLKTFQAREVFGMSIFVGLTAQNTLGVQDSIGVPCSFVEKQFESLAADFEIKAAKTGMLVDEEHVKTVVKCLKRVNFGPLVVDPVMIAKGGHSLLDQGAIAVIKEELLPLATVLTPNLPEAEVLVGYKIDSEETLCQAGLELQQLGSKNIVMKGGHFSEASHLAQDFVLLEDGTSFWMESPRIQTNNTHGTGDTFSSCIVAELAKGKKLEEAILLAKRFIQGAITEGIEVGHGHGPTNHWASLSEEVTQVFK